MTCTWLGGDGLVDGARAGDVFPSHIVDLDLDSAHSH